MGRWEEMEKMVPSNQSMFWTLHMFQEYPQISPCFGQGFPSQKQQTPMMFGWFGQKSQASKAPRVNVQRPISPWIRRAAWTRNSSLGWDVYPSRML
jgi:hypothetical protein